MDKMIKFKKDQQVRKRMQMLDREIEWTEKFMQEKRSSMPQAAPHATRCLSEDPFDDVDPIKMAVEKFTGDNLRIEVVQHDFKTMKRMVHTPKKGTLLKADESYYKETLTNNQHVRDYMQKIDTKYTSYIEEEPSKLVK